MPTISRLYEVTLIAEYAGQQIVNRWNYLGTGDDVPSKPAFGLASALGAAETGTVFADGSLFKSLTTFQLSTLVYHQCLVRAVYVPVDFVDIPFPTGKPGAVVLTDGFSPFVAIGFRTNRVRTDIGRGYKRFAGISKSSTDDAGVIGSTLLANLAAIATQMGTILTFTEGSLTVNFAPVIVGKQNGKDEEPPFGYRYYPTEAQQAEHLASGVAFEPYTRVRSQVSRQYGKGK